jgi:hypothetical protein
MHIQDSHPYLTLALGIWAPIGPLVGITIAHLLSKSWQRRQWELDNVKDETREMLQTFTALVPAFTMWARHCRFYSSTNEAQVQQMNKFQDEYIERTTAFHCALKDRLFIATDVKRLRIKERWATAMKQYHDTYNESALEQEVDAICEGLTSIARH